MRLNTSFSLGRILGIPVLVHWTVPVFLVWLLLGSSSVAVALPVACLTLASVLTHELAHCLVARRVGAQAEKILLWPLGGLAYVTAPDHPRDELRIALAGPLSHLPWMAAAALVTWTGASDYVRTVASLALLWQLRLCLFNLCLPAWPLDGGRILVAALRLRGQTVRRTALVMTTLCGAVALLLAASGHLALGAWLLFEAAQLGGLYQAGRLDGHPLFPQRREACPHCSRPLPATASMCGACERVVR